MGKTEFWQCLFSCLIVFSLSACVRESDVINKDIDQQEAIDIALEIASMSIPPDISGSEVAPSNIHAEKMTIEEVSKRLNSNPQDAFPEVSLDTQVWLVSMDGIWLRASVPGVIQQSFHHLSIVIDPKTGSEIFMDLQQ